MMDIVYFISCSRRDETLVTTCDVDSVIENSLRTEKQSLILSSK